MNKQSNELMREYHERVSSLLKIIRHCFGCVGVLQWLFDNPFDSKLLSKYIKNI